MDLMAQQRSFRVGDEIRVKTRKLYGTDFDCWVQDWTKKIRDTVLDVEASLASLATYSKPTIVFLKKLRFPGFSGYDYQTVVQIPGAVFA